jgi:16S rRNA (uracil1498-N3)-methyltransferase
MVLSGLSPLMRRFFVPAPDLLGPEVPLPMEVVHHLATVLRLSRGAEILLLDGAGTVCRCRIEQLDRRSGRATVLERWRQAETAFPLRLLQGVPKGDKMEMVLQKGTELGVCAFTPVLAGRSIAGGGGAEGNRQKRWQRVLEEAARQSRRAHLPRLDAPLPLAAALAASQENLRLLLWEKGALPLAEALPTQRPADAAVLVGPEGGFSDTEAAQAMSAGFLPVGLGPRILRTETAGLALAAILQFHYGDLRQGAGGKDLQDY